MNVCSTCGSPVNAFYEPVTKRTFIACSQYMYTHHEGIAREAEIRRSKKGEEQLTQEIGEKKALALRQYQGLTTLTNDQAKEIVNTIWPGATPKEVYKAINVCVTYGLNPLMKHVYLIPFENKKTGKDEFVCVLGIGATRLIASRKHTYSFVDDTPRIMTEVEEIKKYGKVDKTKLRFVTKLKDVKTGAEASGWGEISSSANVFGTDKGNSKENICAIRSERQALDRLYPADMPSADIPVVDDNYVDSTATVIDEPVKEVTAPLVPPSGNISNDHLAPSAAEPPKAPDKPQDAQQTGEKPKEVLTPGQRLAQAMEHNSYTKEEIKAHLKSRGLPEDLRSLKPEQMEKLILEVANAQVAKKGGEKLI
jgi:hypothetical protein